MTTFLAEAAPLVARAAVLPPWMDSDAPDPRSPLQPIRDPALAGLTDDVLELLDRAVEAIDLVIGGALCNARG